MDTVSFQFGSSVAPAGQPAPLWKHQCIACCYPGTHLDTLKHVAGPPCWKPLLPGWPSHLALTLVTPLQCLTCAWQYTNTDAA